MIKSKSTNRNHFIFETEMTHTRSIGEDISLVNIVDPAIEKVVADSGKIDQVLINIAANANFPRCLRI